MNKLHKIGLVVAAAAVAAIAYAQSAGVFTKYAPAVGLQWNATGETYVNTAATGAQVGGVFTGTNCGTSGDALLNNGNCGALGTGTVTSVNLTDGSTTPIYTFGGAVTTSGNITQTLTTQLANRVFAGGASGGAAQPAFRALVAADIPTISLTAGVSGILPVANGGTGTASPGLVQGTNITITGTWPNQTINASGGSGCTLANPTGTVGLSAVNGSATTCMRSDAAPALSQAISPTMTGQWTWSPSGGTGLTINAPASGTVPSLSVIQTTLGTTEGVLIQGPTGTASTFATGASLAIGNGSNGGTFFSNNGTQTELWQLLSGTTWHQLVSWDTAGLMHVNGGSHGIVYSFLVSFNGGSPSITACTGGCGSTSVVHNSTGVITVTHNIGQSVVFTCSMDQTGGSGGPYLVVPGGFGTNSVPIGTYGTTGTLVDPGTGWLAACTGMYPQ